jgi:membrane protease YdiL (CAAX protease family)
MSSSVVVSSERSLREVFVYYALACALTWALGLPATLAFLRHEAPSAAATAAAGLSALGPLFAALVVGLHQGSVRRVFRIRTSSSWMLWAALALLAPLALRLVAAVVTAGLGWQLSQSVYPPELPTQVAALIVFPLGEEFGWRGFAYPRLRDRYGVVYGSLFVGAMWSLWHLGYLVDMRTGELGWVAQLESLISLPLYSVILTWFFEKARGSLAVAITFHAAAHLNHIELAPRAEVGFHVTHLLVVGAAAAVAARALSPGRRGLEGACR